MRMQLSDGLVIEIIVTQLAHDYGEAFAEETLTLAESLIKDAKHLKDMIDDE